MIFLWFHFRTKTSHLFPLDIPWLQAAVVARRPRPLRALVAARRWRCRRRSTSSGGGEKHGKDTLHLLYVDEIFVEIDCYGYILLHKCYIYRVP